MVLIGECIPCQFGDHDHHHEVIQAVPEGVMGGAVCGCQGECRDRPKPSARRVEGSVLPRSLRDFDELIAQMASAPSEQEAAS